MIVCSINMAQKDAFSVPGGRQRLAQQGCGRLEQPDRGCMKTHNLFVRVIFPMLECLSRACLGKMIVFQYQMAAHAAKEISRFFSPK